MRIPRSKFRLAACSLAFFFGAGAVWRVGATQPARADAQTLSPAGQAYLRAVIQRGILPGLRWPNFSKYRQDAASFYQFYGFGLPWISGMQPTPQAHAAVAILEHAGAKGLRANDYDGPRWPERLAKLQTLNGQPTEAQAISFDVALTVTLMRYISDLHTGRVDPHVFRIDVDIASRRYDLPKFLEENVVHTADVAVSLSQAEPPYPGYQRTIRALHTYQRLAKVKDTGQPFPAAKKTIAPGQTYVAVDRLAKFLRLVGDLPENIKAPPQECLSRCAREGGEKVSGAPRLGP